MTTPTTSPSGLNVDRIRRLAEDPNSDLPPITEEQARQTARILKAGAGQVTVGR